MSEFIDYKTSLTTCSEPLAVFGGQLGSRVLSRTTRCFETETEARTPPSPGKGQSCSYETPNSGRRGHQGRWPLPQSLARQLTSDAHPIGGKHASTPPPTRSRHCLTQYHPPSHQRRTPPQALPGTKQTDKASRHSPPTNSPALITLLTPNVEELLVGLCQLL